MAQKGNVGVVIVKFARVVGIIKIDVARVAFPLHRHMKNTICIRVSKSRGVEAGVVGAGRTTETRVIQALLSGTLPAHTIL